MADIFQTTPTFGGAFSMDEAHLTFAVGADNNNNNAGLGLLIQSVNIQYSRPIQKVFELGPSKTTYYVAGRAEGRMQVSRLAAPVAINTAFLQEFGNVCNVANNTLVINANPGVSCGPDSISQQGTAASLQGIEAKASRYTLAYCLVDNVQFQMTVQSLALTENLSLAFVSMEIEETDLTPATYYGAVQSNIESTTTTIPGLPG